MIAVTDRSKSDVVVRISDPHTSKLDLLARAMGGSIGQVLMALVEQAKSLDEIRIDKLQEVITGMGCIGMTRQSVFIAIRGRPEFLSIGDPIIQKLIGDGFNALKELGYTVTE